MAVDVTRENFEKEVIQSDTPVLVDFWAPWCGPCKMVVPVIDEIAKEYEGKVKVAKINIDDAAEIASQYNVMSIPTLMIFKNGEVLTQTVGALSKSDLIKLLAPHVG
ncbi:MAG: thioredoxin [Candidatus Omnitrophica bacterium]|nr:thioredoxin [Candidatus Omnitrophota bacterium]